MARLRIGKTRRAELKDCSAPTISTVGDTIAISVDQTLRLELDDSEASFIFRRLAAISISRAWTTKWPEVQTYKKLVYNAPHEEDISKSTSVVPEPATYPSYWTKSMIVAAERERAEEPIRRQFLPEIERMAADLADMYHAAMKDAYLPDAHVAHFNAMCARAGGFQTAHDHLVRTCGLKRPALKGEWACRCVQCLKMVREK